jgi:hypothetical protein
MQTESRIWSDSGVEPDSGAEVYSGQERPIAEYDNWFNWAISTDVDELASRVNTLELVDQVTQLTFDTEANRPGDADLTTDDDGWVYFEIDTGRVFGANGGAWTQLGFGTDDIDGDALAPDAVDSGHIQANAVGSSEVADASIDESHLGFDTATQSELDSHTGGTSNPHSVGLEQARSVDNTLSGDLNLGGYDLTNVSDLLDGGTVHASFDGTGNITVPNGDLLDGAGNVIYDQANNWIPQTRLENDSVTIAGNPVGLGGSTTPTLDDFGAAESNVNFGNNDLKNAGAYTIANRDIIGKGGGRAIVTFSDSNENPSKVTINYNSDYSDTQIGGNVEILNDKLDVGGSNGQLSLGGSDALHAYGGAGLVINESNTYDPVYVDLASGGSMSVRSADHSTTFFKVNDGGNVEIPKGDFEVQWSNPTSGTRIGDFANGSSLDGNVIESKGSLNLLVDSIEGSASDWRKFTLGWGGNGDPSAATRWLTVDDGNVKIPNGGMSVSGRITVRHWGHQIKLVDNNDTVDDIVFDKNGGKLSIRNDTDSRELMKLGDNGDIDIPNGSLTVQGDTLLKDVSGSVANSNLSNSTVTVAGNSVGLGGSTSIAHADISSVGADDHHNQNHDNADHTTNMVEDATTTGNGPYEIQKNGSDGSGVINFKT